MRLRRSDLRTPGIRRVRRGKGFSYVDPDGTAVDAEVKARIRALVIPPAWRDVWICPWPNGHIQAVGTDDAGRRQYLYHPDWRTTRDKQKHARVRDLADRLPDVRATLSRQLRRRGLPKERVTAAALRMLDAGLFRTGGEEYEHQHGTHGVATLLREHVVVSGDRITFSFPAKSGQHRDAVLHDAVLAKAIRSMKRSRAPGGRLLQYRADDRWHELSSAEINTAFKDLVGAEHSVKDLRTWAATVLAAVALAEHASDEGEPTDAAVTEVMRVVSEHLGNTPAVARSSYVDGRVTEEYAAGHTIARALTRASAADRRRLARGEFGDVRHRETLERAVIRLLR